MITRSLALYTIPLNTVRATMRTSTYRYIDADSASRSVDARRDPDGAPRPAIEDLVAAVTARVRSTWSPRASLALAIRERNVRLFLCAVATGARSRDLAREEGLSLRQTQRAVKAGREAVAEAAPGLDRREVLDSIRGAR